MRTSRIGWLVAVALGIVSPGAGAQTDPRLVDAVRTAQEGQGDSARATVDRLLAATPPTDTLYPQILYTHAMVAGTAGNMRRQLQRVAVEYGTSSWADDALLRLVQMDYATRNYEGAGRNLERLRLDFPSTALLPQAAYWAGRTYFDANNPAAACRWLADGMAASRNDIELQNQLGYLYQRCGRADTAAAASGDSTRADTGVAVGDSARPDTSVAAGGATTPADSTAGAARPPSSPPAAGTPAGSPDSAPVSRPPARTTYRVQIAAVRTRQAAEAAARKVRPLGLTVVTVEDDGLYKVRIGEYRTREAAQTAAASLRTRLGGSPFVVAEP